MMDLMHLKSEVIMIDMMMISLTWSDPATPGVAGEVTE